MGFVSIIQYHITLELPPLSSNSSFFPGPCFRLCFFQQYASIHYVFQSGNCLSFCMADSSAMSLCSAVLSFTVSHLTLTSVSLTLSVNFTCYVLTSGDICYLLSVVLKVMHNSFLHFVLLNSLLHFIHLHLYTVIFTQLLLLCQQNTSICIYQCCTT